MGLSKSLSINTRGKIYIINERVLGHHFKGSPLSIILVDNFYIGQFIKTYFQRYKVLYGFKRPKYVTIKTSKSFYVKNINNVGMSIFRRPEFGQIVDTVPMPPGTLYLGNPAYGNWVLLDHGEEEWHFHRPYNHFYKYFGWKNFHPTKSFYLKLKSHLKVQKTFYGDKGQFGTNKKLTKVLLDDIQVVNKRQKVALKSYFNQLLMWPSFK